MNESLIAEWREVISSLESDFIQHILGCLVSTAHRDEDGDWQVDTVADDARVSPAAEAFAGWLEALARTPTAEYLAQHLGFPDAAARRAGDVTTGRWITAPGLFGLAAGALDSLDVDVPERWASAVKHWPAAAVGPRTGQVLRAVKAQVDARRTPVRRRAAAAPAAAAHASVLDMYLALVADSAGAADGPVPCTAGEQALMFGSFGLTVEEAPRGAADRATWRAAADTLLQARTPSGSCCPPHACTPHAPSHASLSRWGGTVRRRVPTWA